MGTTIETLGIQHRTVLAHLNEFEAGTPGRPALEALHAFLAGEVDEHFGLEEEALFPVLARHPQLAVGPLAVMEVEHREFRALVGELAAALDADDPRAPAVARAIGVLLRAHIDKEDRVLFPLAGHLLSAAELQEVEARAAACASGGGGPAQEQR
jgi:hemerythrin-like domain-containing protein